MIPTTQPLFQFFIFLLPILRTKTISLMNLVVIVSAAPQSQPSTITTTTTDFSTGGGDNNDNNIIKNKHGNSNLDLNGMNLQNSRDRDRDRDRDRPTNDAMLTIVDESDNALLPYRAKLATNFGRRIKYDQLMYYATLTKLPRDYRNHLCDGDDNDDNVIQNILFGNDNLGYDINPNTGIAVRRNYQNYAVEYPVGPIGLMVSLNGGDCNILKKAKNALRIQQRITKNLLYIVFYNDIDIDGDSDIDPDKIVTLSLLKQPSGQVVVSSSQSPSQPPTIFPTTFSPTSFFPTTFSQSFPSSSSSSSTTVPPSPSPSPSSSSSSSS
eukprot:CAMPEP_0170929480 /NCGR_PEP_ID=MMETSP0735-20130129/14844_1 /TAXON_ID=186038 /ORGANISM="Fragilariopsis kerguelensis, Strain L26-C5" /LENGTH=323 /DNA_ID=CAMNT_0011330639 /DNA_START=606 /DNA_END=1573 /DNA_ORIENTATION=+